MMSGGETVGLRALDFALSASSFRQSSAIFTMNISFSFEQGFESTEKVPNNLVRWIMHAVYDKGWSVQGA